MEKIPKEAVILLSFLNTKLRDYYPSLAECCQALGVDQADIEARLSAIDYYYDENRNQFL